MDSCAGELARWVSFLFLKSTNVKRLAASSVFILAAMNILYGAEQNPSDEIKTIQDLIGSKKEGYINEIKKIVNARIGISVIGPLNKLIYDESVDETNRIEAISLLYWAGGIYCANLSDLSVSGNTGVKLAALSVLNEYNIATPNNEIERFLFDNDARVARKTVYYLADINAGAYKEYLSKYCKESKDELMRIAASYYFSKLFNEKQAMEYLSNMLDKDNCDIEIITASIEAAGKLDNEMFLPLLVGKVSSESSTIKMAALKSLAKMKSIEGLNNETLLKSIKREFVENPYFATDIIEVIEKIGKPMVKPMKEIIDMNVDDLTTSACLVLASIDADNSCIGIIKKIGESENIKLKMAAAYYLGSKYDDNDSIKYLYDCYLKLSGKDKKTAMQFLCGIKNKSANKYIEDILSKADKFEMTLIASRVKYQRLGESAVKTLLGNDDADVICILLLSLTNNGNLSDIPLLYDKLNSRKPIMRSMASNAIMKILDANLKNGN